MVLPREPQGRAGRSRDVAMSMNLQLAMVTTREQQPHIHANIKTVRRCDGVNTRTHTHTHARAQKQFEG